MLHASRLAFQFLKISVFLTAACQVHHFVQTLNNHTRGNHNHSLQCNGWTNTTESPCSCTQDHVHSLSFKCSVSSLCFMSSPLTFNNTGYASPQDSGTPDSAWKGLRVHQAERPTFKTSFSEAAASHPKGGTCIIHVHLHNLPYPYHGFITLSLLFTVQ